MHIAPVECVNNSYSFKPFKVETSEIAEIVLLIKSCLAELKTIGK